ncbi:MAG TPA: hypothetical protein VK390_12450 [Propionibacteriaceae bacterium]|nr:hypothetical protein [Propionibacteriaceae bacterium]
MLQSTPSRLSLLNAVIEVLEHAGGDVAPSGGAGCRRRTHDLADLVEREAHLAEQQDGPDECDRSFVVSALSRPSIIGLQDVELLVVAQGRTRHPRTLRQLSDRQQLTVDHLASRVFEGIAWPKAQDIREQHSRSTERPAPP